MKKWIALLKSVVFSFVIYMWFLGSSLLISIDERAKFDNRKRMISNNEREREKEMLKLTSHISDYCRTQFYKRGRDEIQFRYSSNTVDAREKLLKARKDKTVRDNLIYIPELDQLWCLVPKAASTSWSHKIIESLNVKDGKFERDLRNVSVPVQVVLKKHFGNLGTKKYDEVLKSRNTKVLLVRHPFSRLVSAFEDKLKDRKAKGDSMYFFGHYGVKINRAFRKNKRINKRKEPTFEEFLEYLIHTDPIDYDEHWKPISLLCGLCNVQYDHIIRQEELKNPRVMNFHLMKLKFENTQNLEHLNQMSQGYKSVDMYFKNISSEKIYQVFKKYENDFNLFGYHYKDFT